MRKVEIETEVCIRRRLFQPQFHEPDDSSGVRRREYMDGAMPVDGFNCRE